MARLTRMEQLRSDAKAAGLIVDTYSPGDGVTRYRFFKAGGYALPRAVTYFNGHDPVDTVLGIAKAEQFVSDYVARQEYAARAKRDEVLISASPKPTMADVKRANIEYHHRRGEDFSFFDKKTTRHFGPEKFYGPYAGPGGIFFVNVNRIPETRNLNITIREVRSTGDIGLPRGNFSHVEDARDAAKAMAKGTRAAASNPSRRRR